MADYLAKKGLPFRKAHAVVGRAVAKCIEEKKVLKDLTLAEFREMSPLFEEDIYDVLDIENCVKNRGAFGGTSPENVRRQQADAETEIARMKEITKKWQAVSAFLN